MTHIMWHAADILKSDSWKVYSSFGTILETFKAEKSLDFVFFHMRNLNFDVGKIFRACQ